MSADNITFAVDDLCTSQRLRPVRRVAAERLVLLTVVVLILVIVQGGTITWDHKLMATILLNIT